MGQFLFRVKGIQKLLHGLLFHKPEETCQSIKPCGVTLVA